MAAPKTRTGIGTTTTTTTVVEVKLSPKVRKELAGKIAEVVSLQVALKDLKLDRDKKLVEIEKLYVDSNEGHALDTGTMFDVFKLKKVGGTTSKLDKKKFVSYGGSLAVLERATVTKPRKPYLKVTAPGEKDDAETDS